MTIPLRIVLFFLVFLAGFIDSIAGGGGLISLTSYYAMGLPPAVALGNNKLSSFSGTLFATINYGRKGKIIWRLALLSAMTCLLGSALGAQIALRFADTILRYVLLVALPVLTVFLLRERKSRKSGMIKVRDDLRGYETTAKAYGLSMVLSFCFGLYDGFFGPGTGTFFTIMFSFLGLEMLDAVGTTKFLNLTSNFAAITTFILNGNIDYNIGIPCIIASILGNLSGSSYAMKRDAKVIRKLLVFVIALLYIKIVVEFFL